MITAGMQTDEFTHHDGGEGCVLAHWHILNTDISCRRRNFNSKLRPLYTYWIINLLTNWLTQWNKVLPEKLTGTQAFPYFMQPEGKLPHLQVSATCPYPQRGQSSLRLNAPLLKDSFYYYPPIYTWVFQAVSFHQISPPKLCIHLSSCPYVLHALPVSFFLIWSPE